MIPRIAVCNIFGQDAHRLAYFAKSYGFQGIDWSIDPYQPEDAFMVAMEALSEFEVRFHCPFPNADIAFADDRAVHALKLHKKIIKRIAKVGGRHVTVHIGFGKHDDRGLELAKAIENLKALVQWGNVYGVCVSLENLRAVWTDTPDVFHRIVQQSGINVTFDIGHAYACKNHLPCSDICKHYIIPNRNSITNAHIYHTELDGTGHIAPQSIEDIYERLELLRKIHLCTWWVIELYNKKDILNTRKLLNQFFGN